jgi:hypothetical protein
LAIARGGTLVYDRIQECHPPLESFVDQLSEETQTRVASTVTTLRGVRKGLMFISTGTMFLPSRSMAASVGFIARTRMCCHARCATSLYRRWMKNSGWQSVLLKQGDVFYCPRGIWHFTQTEENHSAHLALGWYPLTLGDWIKKLESHPEIGELLEEYVQQPGMKRRFKAKHRRARQPD